MYKYSSFLIFVICVILNISQVLGQCGDRSRFLLGAEDYCWTQKVEIVDRIKYTQKSVLNFAKKKLGMDSEEPIEAQKCDYYYCTFSQMKLINPEYDVPCIERISKWVKKNVVYNDAEILLSRIQACSGELGDAMGSKTSFLADNVDLPSDKRTRTGGIQSKCEIAAEYMKCLANAKNLECQVFQYP